MKTTKTLAWVVALGALASSFMSCSQTPAACQVGQAGNGQAFAVRFIPKGTMPACATSGSFNVNQMGDLIGMASYHPPTPGANGSTTYNVHITTIALQSDTLGREAEAYAGYSPPGYLPVNMQTPAELASGQHLYSAAQFTDEDPGPNDQCPVTNSSWAPAKQTFTAVAAEPAGPMGMPPALPALPQDSWEYDWSNMQVYVTAADQGVQFAADLTLTETDGTGTSCSMQYHAIGLWPDVSCSRQIEDGSFVADLDMCNPCAEPLLGRATGSGISPDALTDCVQLFSQDDPRGPYYCVLHGTNDPPVLNPAPPTCEGTVMSLGNGTGGAPGMGAGGMGGAPGAGGAGGAGGSSSDAGTDGPADASGE